MVDLKELVKKLSGILFLITVIAFSAYIFLKREEISQVSELSYLGIIAVCFLANATVFLPSPSLMVVASCALILNPFLVAFCGAFGSALGELVGYAAGNVGGEISPKFRALAESLTQKIRHDWLLVFLLALLPLPLFDVVGVYSGGKRMNLWLFLFVCLLGKFLKTLLYTRAYDVIGWATSDMFGQLR